MRTKVIFACAFSLALAACEHGPSALDTGLHGDAAVARNDREVRDVDVLTQHNDVARTGANLEETLLTTENVNRAQFGKLNCLPVDDQIYAQPLVVHGIRIGGTTKRVLYVATVDDSVYAFDADAPLASTFLWRATLLAPDESPVRNTDLAAVGACGGQYTDFSGNIGVVGTPVIDPATSTLYAIARSKANGAFFQRLHAIDLATGAERANSPVTVGASVPGAGDGTSRVVFDPLRENQRTALLLNNGVVYATWSGHCDLPPYHGWILGYDARDLKQVVVYNDTPDGSEGGIWMSGGGPAADDGGAIYVATANGSVGSASDATDTANRSESLVKLEPRPGTLLVSSWFTPWNYGDSDVGDVDFGVTGVALVPGTTLAVSGAKDATIYVVDKDAMGGLNPLAVDDQIVQTLHLPVLPTPGAVGFFGSPVFWDSLNGPLMYLWGSNSTLASYHFDRSIGQFGARPLATGATESAPPLQSVALSLSANGSEEGTGILWATHAVGGNPNHQNLPGILRAFDAADVSVELWNSAEDPTHDNFGDFAKFGYPTVANGYVFVPTFSNQVCIYGLRAPTPVPTPTAPIDVAAVAISNTAVHLTCSDPSAGQRSVVIERALAGETFVAAATLSSNACALDDVGLEPYATYTYRARLLVASGGSRYSRATEVVTNGGPPAPALLVTGRGMSLGADPTSSSGALFEAARIPSAVSHTFVIANRGAAPLEIVATDVTGPGANAFTATRVPARWIAPGESDTIVVRFAPVALGSVRATVTVSSDDPVSPSYSFDVQGSGMSDLVGWWKCADGAGRTALDSSGYGDPAALNGAASFVRSGPLNGALLLSGMASAEVQPDAALSPSGAITVAAWIYPLGALTANANPRLLQKGAADNQYRLLVEDGALKFDLAGIGAVTIPTLPSAGKWTHVAGTYDGLNLQLWMDGTAVATKIVAGSIPATNDPLFIGAKQGSTAEGDYFQGLLEDVRVYRRALASEEIEELARWGDAGDGGVDGFDASGIDASEPTVHFASQVLPIFEAYCVSCHASPGPAGGLDLMPGSAFANVVNVQSGEQPPFELVQPGDASRSYLYAKVAGATTAISISGAVMPQGAARLSSNDVAAIRTWVAQGASNN